MTMTPDEYQKLALVTETTPTYVDHLVAIDSKGNGGLFNDQLSRLLHGAIGICTEAGELQDAIKKHLIYGKPLDKVNVLEECGDVLWYIAVALDSCGFTMEQAMDRNIAKLKARYGGKFSAEKALNHDTEKERQILEGK